MVVKVRPLVAREGIEFVFGDDSPSWFDYVTESWEVPAELQAPTPYTETNLTIQILSCPALKLDREAGKFLVAALAQHDFVVERQSRATTDPRWFAEQYVVGQREQQAILSALQNFRNLEKAALADGEVGALRRARRREVQVAIQAAIDAYEFAMSQD
ncbi:hypothetical protein ACIGB8_27875 [Promicromonospora sukumoe]|uniref:hypothetical protein n=1 Tax=Promicromonospora sukumoe TaxID=88382 RepID=UPI0037C8277D